MKSICIILLATGFLLLVRSANAGYGTNSFFVTADGIWWNDENIEAAKTNMECQPAEDDPSGHWGAVVCGRELSIRFNENIFQSNEPIVATIIYRNVGTNVLNNDSPYGGDLDFQFVIQDKDGNQLTDSFTSGRTTGHGLPWIPGTQYKYKSNVTKRYGLSKAGTYSISVHRKLPNRGGGWLDLSSGTATITIIK